MRNKTSLCVFFGLIILLLVIQSSSFAQLPPSVPGLPPFPEIAQFNIQLAELYVDLYPEANKAHIICVLWLICDSNPVIVKLGGNLLNMSIKSDQKNIDFIRVPPYFYFDNLATGSHQITFDYTVIFDGIITKGLISNTSINLGYDSFWYPRNIASDPHQAILSIESPPNYPISSNAELKKEVPNNLKTLREFILSTASDTGLILK